MNTPNHPQAAPSASAVLPHEEKLHHFWKKNRNTIFAACVAVLLVVAGRGGWEIYSAQREKSIEADYAAATTPEKLRAFVRDHAGHRLTGVASLRLADDEYSAGKYSEALADYGTAVSTLRDTPLGGRALLGQAICKLRSGLSADGENQLRQLAADLSQLQAVRAEAAYCLASRAADDGRIDDAKKFADQVQQIDAQGIWAQRALALRASLPADGVPGGAAPSGGVQLQVPGK
ncbi:MAG TPA: tetratricopeptide repeat protein [Opitutaceae bacterium]|nr:tetratricopeptide repeat protein [Opitutaceae bacterium]